MSYYTQDILLFSICGWKRQKNMEKCWKILILTADGMRSICLPVEIHNLYMFCIISKYEKKTRKVSSSAKRLVWLPKSLVFHSKQMKRENKALIHYLTRLKHLFHIFQIWLFYLPGYKIQNTHIKVINYISIVAPIWINVVDVKMDKSTFPSQML